MKEYKISIDFYPFAYLLTAIFVILKLMGTIAWSWWWVTSPLWIPFALLFAGFMVWGLFLALFAIIALIVSLCL